MQAQPPEYPEQANYEELLTGAEAGLSIETSQPTQSRRQLLLPVGASIAVHICLAFLLRQLMPGTGPGITDIHEPTPSIRISFRPRPEPEPDPQPVQQEELPLPEPIVADNEPPTAEQPVMELPTADSSEPPPPAPTSAAPRLVAPALLDVRDLIQNRAQNDATSRIYNNINCDERQRRTDLIDCGDEDPGTRYNFAAAEQNATVEFFADLNLPAEDTGSQPPDRSSTAARTRAAQQNMTGNLGANPLIRSVMGQP